MIHDTSAFDDQMSARNLIEADQSTGNMNGGNYSMDDIEEDNMEDSRQKRT